jgi:hypothetical protein
VPVGRIDADLNAEIDRRLFPNIKVTKIEVEPMAIVIQVVDTTCSKNRLLSFDGAPPHEKERAVRRFGDVQVLLEFLSFLGLETLCATNKPVADRLRSEALPHAAMGHFGSLRGLDCYNGLGAVVVAGREQPSAQAAEDWARSFYGDDPEPLTILGTDGQLVGQCRPYRMRDGISLARSSKFTRTLGSRASSSKCASASPHKPSPASGPFTAITPYL